MVQTGRKTDKIPLVTPNDDSFGEYSFVSIMLRLKGNIQVNIKQESQLEYTYANERFTKRDIDNTNAMPAQSRLVVCEFMTPVTSS
jgi:hypothetical protein